VVKKGQEGQVVKEGQEGQVVKERQAKVRSKGRKTDMMSNIFVHKTRPQNPGGSR
jgi:hypothetical protein